LVPLVQVERVVMILVHTADAAAGLGMPFAPDPVLAARVVRRLFPWAPGHSDPWAVLLWSNGRAPLGERPRRARVGDGTAPLPTNGTEGTRRRSTTVAAWDDRGTRTEWIRE
jgi:hypothetical protein